MTKDIANPDYYKSCSPLGRIILFSANFPEEYEKYLELECKEFIHEILQDNFHLGNAFKYLWRLNKKRKTFFWQNSKAILEDLKKSKWYLEEYISLNLIGESAEVCAASMWLTQIKFEINQEIFRRSVHSYWEVIIELF